MLRQTFIHKSIVGIEKIQNGPVFVHDAFKQQLRFPLEGLPKVIVEIGKLAAIGTGAFQIPKIQPLAGEVGGQRAGPIVGQHPARFALQDGGFVQLTLHCQGQQLIVGNAGPQEKR